MLIGCWLELLLVLVDSGADSVRVRIYASTRLGISSRQSVPEPSVEVSVCVGHHHLRKLPVLLWTDHSQFEIVVEHLANLAVAQARRLVPRVDAFLADHT